MAVEDYQRTSDLAPTGHRGTALVVFRVVAAIVSVLALLCGAGLLIACGLWLADLEQQPREPPGQIVALIPLAGAAVGAVLSLIGVTGLTLVILSRWLASWQRYAKPGAAADGGGGGG